MFGQVYTDGSENELPALTGNEGRYLAVNPTATDVEWVEPDTALDLLPSISGQANKILAVDPTATGLIWIDDQTSTPYTDEQVRDVMGATLLAGTNVSLVVNDAADTITINAVAGANYPSFTGNAEKVLAVNATEDGVEWVDQASGTNESDPGWVVSAVGTGVSQDITLPETNLLVTDVFVFINGLRFETGEYTSAGVS